MTFTCPSSGNSKQARPPKRRDVLILLAHRLLQNLDFDLAGLLGDHRRIDVVALERVDRAQQPDGESARRSQAGAGGNIGHADHFDGRTDVVHPERFSDQRMTDVVERDWRAPARNTSGSIRR